MRFVYLDESGISSRESTAVVAGVIINADAQWKIVEEAVNEIIKKYIPPLFPREWLIFHAADMFHGSGKVFRSLPRDLRHEALKELLAIPYRFHLPVVYGYVRKEDNYDVIRNRTLRARLIKRSIEINHSVAFTLCAAAAESYMRKHAAPAEIATLIAENNTQTRTAVKELHDVLRGSFDGVETKSWTSSLKLKPDFLPFRKIVDAVHFAEKSDAFLLQIADASALIIRYFLEQKPGTEDFVKAFAPDDKWATDRLRGHGGFAIFNFQKPPL